MALRLHSQGGQPLLSSSFMIVLARNPVCFSAPKSGGDFIMRYANLESGFAMHGETKKTAHTPKKRG